MTGYIEFKYTLTPQTRVSAGKGGEVRFLKKMQEIIRGSVVRGALGAAWWNPADPGASLVSSPQKQAVFNEVFGRQLYVRQAIPVNGERAAKLQPISVNLCKYQPKPECKEFESNAATCNEILEACPICGGSLKQGKGWSVPSSWHSTVTTTRITEQGVAKKHHLFSRQVYNKTIVLTGTLRLNTDFRNFEVSREWLETGRFLSIGGKKSVLGRVKWQVEQLTPEKTFPTTELVALELQSPAILVDELGFPILDLKQWLGWRGKGEIIEQWIRPTTESGWNSIANMPKPMDWALAAGSVALLRGWDNNDLHELSQGIGLRQDEGFGEVKLIESSATERCAQ